MKILLNDTSFFNPVKNFYLVISNDGKEEKAFEKRER